MQHFASSLRIPLDGFWCLANSPSGCGHGATHSPLSTFGHLATGPDLGASDLIREAEDLWHVDVKDLRRLGALELDQLLHEVPTGLRPRVNRWLKGYGAKTRMH